MTTVQKKIISTALVLTLLASFIATSLCGLYTDVINPDGINWHTRSYNFTEALINRDFAETFQAYHPGITLMWLTGPVLHLLGSYYESKGYAAYSRDTYLNYDYLAKVTVVITSFLLFIISLLLLRKLVSNKSLLAFSVLLIFEPFIIGLRRLYHIDYLMAYLVFISFLCFYIFSFKYVRSHFYILGALFFVLALLTKTSALMLLPIIFLMLVLGKQSLGKKFLTIILLPFALSAFIYFLVPALWVNPLINARSIYKKMATGVIDIGIYNKKEIGLPGDKDSLIEDVSRGGGIWYFYLLEIPYVLSPVSLGFLAVSVIRLIYMGFKKQISILNIFSFLAFIIFLVGLSIADKKGLRYGIVFFPFLFVIMSNWLSNLPIKIFSVSLGVLLISLIPQYISIYPYFYVYGNPLLGGVKSRTMIFDPGSFGVGAYEACQYINSVLKPNTDYTVIAPKSFKYTCLNVKVTTRPSCESDFDVIYALDDTPIKFCPGMFHVLRKVRIGNLDYWTIYAHVGI